MFCGIPRDRRCASSKIIYLPYYQPTSKNNRLIEKGRLITFMGYTFENFVHDKLPIIQLTKDKADDADIQNFDDTAAAMAKEMLIYEHEFRNKTVKPREDLRKAEEKRREMEKKTSEDYILKHRRKMEKEILTYMY